MEKGAKWLRASYLIGAAADGLVAIGMFSQAVFATESPHTGAVPEALYRYAIAVAGSLMLGWTLLLIWADRRPLERRGVLFITIVVILGLGACEIFLVAVGLISLGKALVVCGFLAGLILFFGLSLWKSRGRP